MLKCAVQVYVQKLSNTVDEVAEWLRRCTANPMDSVRVGSNPILVVDFAQKDFRFEYFMFRKVVW